MCFSVVRRREAERVLMPDDPIVVTHRSRGGDIAHWNRIDGLFFNVALLVLAHVWLAMSHADEGAQRVPRRKTQYRGQKDRTTIKHGQLLRLFGGTFLRAPPLQAADNRHQIAVSTPLR
jgi:hypothetical protein